LAQIVLALAALDVLASTPYSFGSMRESE